jgi:hypothetical protein
MLILATPPLPPNKPHTNQRTNQPKDRTEERKRTNSAPPITLSPPRDTTPLKRAGATNILVEIDHQPKDGEPAQREEDVDGERREPGREGDQPEKAEEHGQAGHDHGVDEARFRPVGRRGVACEEVGEYAYDHARERDLADPQWDGDEAGDDGHGGGWGWSSERVWGSWELDPGFGVGWRPGEPDCVVGKAVDSDKEWNLEAMYGNGKLCTQGNRTV